MNPYGKCTENKITNGKQCTIQWCVDNNKFTHVSDNVITVVVDIKKKNWRVSCVLQKEAYVSWHGDRTS